MLIRADLRKAMRLRETDTLVAIFQADGTLSVRGAAVGIDKFRRLAAPYLPEGDLVDEFIARRRADWGEKA